MTTNDQPMDHVPPDARAHEDRGSSTLETNVKQKSTWLRLFFMFVLSLLFGLALCVTAVVVIVQFFFVLLAGESKDELKAFGQSMAIYSKQVIEYLSFNTEDKPFPFDGAWPTSTAEPTSTADD